MVRRARLTKTLRPCKSCSPIEAGSIEVVILHAKGPNSIVDDLFIGGSSQSHERNVGVRIPQKMKGVVVYDNREIRGEDGEPQNRSSMQLHDNLPGRKSCPQSLKQ